MNDIARHAAVLASTTVVTVVAIAAASSLGMNAEAFVVCSVILYTACFTVQDWLLKDRGPDASAFLRRSITGNLMLVSIIATLLYALVFGSVLRGSDSSVTSGAPLRREAR